MDEDVQSAFTDEDRELFLRIDMLEILSHMNMAFSYLTERQEKMSYAITAAQRNCLYEKGMLSRLFQALTRHQVRVELDLYPASYARLAHKLATLSNRIVESKPGTDYIVFVPEVEEVMQDIGQHIDFLKNRLDIIHGTETKRKFQLN